MVFAVLPTILPLILSASEEEPSLTCGPTFNGMNGDRPELMTLPFKAVGDFPVRTQDVCGVCVARARACVCV